MDYILLCGLALLLLIIALIDLIGHKYLKIKHSSQGMLLLSVFLLGLILSGFFGLKGYIMETGRKDSSSYLAYRYLMEGDTKSALSSINKASGSREPHKQMVELLAACKDGDYVTAYFMSERIINEMKINKELQNSAKKLRSMSALIWERFNTEVYYE